MPPERPLRILLLAYYFPPLNSTASHRPYSWATTWSTAGHEVHVLTTEKYAFDGTLDLEYPLTGFSVDTVRFLKHAPTADSSRDAPDAGATAQKWDRLKLLTRRARLGLGMFGELAWLAYRPLLKRALELARTRPFDFVVSSSPPEMLHFVGHALSRRTGVPWVADYRDLWFPEMRINQFRASASLTGFLKRPRLAQATAVSTVSEGLAQRLGQFLGREVIVCYNGFMPDAAPRESARPWSDAKLHVVYTGRMFPEKRDPRIFFDGLAHAMQAEFPLSEKLCVDIFGFRDRWIENLVAARGVGQCVRMRGLIPYRQSLNVQRHADLLLFLDWMDERAEGVLTGKLFEYLASGRPILCVGNRRDSEAARIVAQAGAGTAVCTAAEVRDHMLALLRQELPAARPARSDIGRYSRLRQADMLLDRIVRAIHGTAAA